MKKVDSRVGGIGSHSLHAGGQGFESPRLHHLAYAPLLFLVPKGDALEPGRRADGSIRAISACVAP